MGSPGDLSQERKRFPVIIKEVDDILAHSKGIHLEAVGWEDNPGGSGRPQELINQDLKDCDIVVLSLWKNEITTFRGNLRGVPHLLIY